MSTTTMHFGPEWMRTKPQPASRIQSPPSPPPPNASGHTASTYSSLLTTTVAAPAENKDEAHPFRYTKEEMLRIYREGGGKGGLGLEVERWDGVVRETVTDPIGLKEIGEAEKKLFATPLNSDLRRRQSTDYLHLNTQNLERPRLSHANTASATGSPLRERFGSLMTRRRDSTDQPPTLPRRLSLTSQTSNPNPRESGMPSPSPRGRLGHTPGFDGVLNGGESWVARRRASEGLLPKIPANSARDPGEDSKELEIREEDEENHLDSNPEPDPQRGSKATDQLAGGLAMQKPDKIESGAALDVPATLSVSNSPASTSASIGLPPGIVDLSSVEWSYLDPQGQVQGPFQASVMQKWGDGGFFSDELLMKRTYIDNDWIPMGDLKRLVGSTDKVFLTPIPLYGPPGLIRRTDSPFSNLNPNPNEGGYHNGPLQPSPVRTLRNSTLDSFSSNYSDSPTSSFGAAGRFGDGSPDPAAFGGRAAPQYVLPGEMGSRFNGYPGEASPALSGRSGFAAPANDYRSPGFSNVTPGRANSLDVNPGFASPATSWSGFDGMANGRGGSIDSSIYHPGHPNAGMSSPFGNNGFQTSFGTQNHPSLGMGGLAFEQYPPSPSVQFTDTSVMPNAVPDIFDHNQLQQTPARPSQPSTNSSAAASPWGPGDSNINKRNVQFDTTPAKPPAVNNQSPWGTGRVSRSSSQANDLSPWLAASKGVTDNWKEEPSVISDLTSNNLGQHNREEKQLEETAEDVTEIITRPKANIAETQADPVLAPAVPLPTPSHTKTTSRQAQQGTQVKAATTEPAHVISDIPEPQSVVVPSAAPKAWAKEEDSKKSATSLRKIQDAEAKKVEARKTAEREKERAARVATQSIVSPSPEDVQTFTASWGLPTSKAGKGSAAVTPKELLPPTPASASAVPPVWSTSAAKPVATKKTMKEIQEEEERRKKTVAKETVANVASRRAYAESTSKPSPTPAPGASAWTTVGPSGKQTPVATTPTRPPATPTAAAAVSTTSITRVNGAATRPTPTPVSKAPVNSAKVDDFPIAPSTDFLKWLAESLKGLNNTVNVEDIMSMLLSFPIDPDPSTSEIISDLIYANTTTLDGRRFAADFLSRRKADAVARAKAGPGAAATKMVSIADVVKAQPKPQAQSEWGGFKVVNKKKKGGRS
ncbi:hypothetical protein F5879DRAFT_929457 [Lentinula edodes]|nr:hypothetical protein F5879DRAFT_929457 [Lentinula edodes]